MTASHVSMMSFFAQVHRLPSAVKWLQEQPKAQRLDPGWVWHNLPSVLFLATVTCPDVVDEARLRRFALESQIPETDRTPMRRHPGAYLFICIQALANMAAAFADPRLQASERMKQQIFDICAKNLRQELAEDIKEAA